ncbi:oligoendopeptidase F [Sphingomonas psychrotolerans]|uniref:Oligopeptidase F n=1 Tax=Sphingomonas psychrotolerans TaxID=1327635 RepID=A0ABU3N6Z3_9SPHN|nr:oligoendopeptidase F [Sphingomonas psychrotolerans]MDT8759080.1 oligoendopeptidase F [Sphingomonas psychrotolerans]
MPDLSRREALAAGALASLAMAAPGWAQGAAQTAAAAWDLTEIYPSDAAWDEARKAVLAKLPAIAKFKGRLGESAQTLADALILQSDLGKTIGRIYTYVSLKADEDVRVANYQEKQAQAVDLYTAFGEATAWFAPEILSVGKPKIDGFVAANPALKSRFDFHLANIVRQAAHTLSPEGEAILASAGAPLQAPGEIAGQLRSSDIPWPTIKLSTGKEVRLDSQGYTLNRDAPNRADRKAVFDAFWEAHGKFQNSFGASYNAKVKGDIFYAKARKYPTALASALSGANIPEAVYRTLVAEANKGLPQLHRYFDLRRRMLKLPDLAYYDIYPPLVSLDRPFNLDQMRTLTLEAVRPLGPDYQARIAKATAAKWMDPWPRPGKSPGAYMNPGAYEVHPYLLLNLSEKYDGLSTYAHEWGHALHSLLANSIQPYEKADYPIFLAEIASTLNEQLLVAHMLRNAKTREEKLFYLGQQMENFRGTFYRQTMFAEFELKAHDLAEAGEGLSGKKFTSIYFDLLRRYHGPNMKLEESYGNEWAFIPHFYNSFYVYQYATCIAAATWFAQAILKGGARERDNYLSVLKAGGSDYPVDILKRAGLDMASPAPYQALVATMKDTLDQAEALLA